MTNEIWKPIPGYGERYEASSLGHIRVKAKTVMKRDRYGGMMAQYYPGRLMAETIDGQYRCVSMGWSRNRAKVGIHRLVMLAFVGNPQERQECCHANGIASDNRETNLRWDTHLENNRDRDRHRHGHYATGRDHAMAKFTDAQVEAVRMGQVSLSQAMADFRMSRTHYYRIKRTIQAAVR